MKNPQHYDIFVAGGTPGGITCACDMEKSSSRSVTASKRSLLHPKCGGQMPSSLLRHFNSNLGALKKGPHRLDLTRYGHRFNAFGSVHNLNHEHLWAETGPDAWRTVNADSCYEYQLRPMGMLTSPALLGARG